MPLLFIPIVLFAGFGVGAILGAPYLPILSRDVASLLDLAELEPGQQLVDLGSGDGALLIAAAQRGIRAIGYEINPVLYGVSWLRCWRYRKLVRVYLRNYWLIPLPSTDAVYVFLIDHYMAKLDRKLTKEVLRPTKVVSYVFTIPGRRPVRSTKNSYVYIYPNS